MTHKQIQPDIQIHTFSQMNRQKDRRIQSVRQAGRKTETYSQTDRKRHTVSQTLIVCYLLQAVILLTVILLLILIVALRWIRFYETCPSQLHQRAENQSESRFDLCYQCFRSPRASRLAFWSHSSLRVGFQRLWFPAHGVTASSASRRNGFCSAAIDLQAVMWQRLNSH